MCSIQSRKARLSQRCSTSARWPSTRGPATTKALHHCGATSNGTLNSPSPCTRMQIPMKRPLDQHALTAGDRFETPQHPNRLFADGPGLSGSCRINALTGVRGPRRREGRGAGGRQATRGQRPRPSEWRLHAGSATWHNPHEIGVNTVLHRPRRLSGRDIMITAIIIIILLDHHHHSGVGRLNKLIPLPGREEVKRGDHQRVQLVDQQPRHRVQDAVDERVPHEHEQQQVVRPAATHRHVIRIRAPLRHMPTALPVHILRC
jgi:hypothetical protein